MEMSRTYGSGFVQVNIFDTGFTSKSATPPSKLNLLSGLEIRLEVVCTSEGGRSADVQVVIIRRGYSP